MAHTTNSFRIPAPGGEASYSDDDAVRGGEGGHGGRRRDDLLGTGMGAWMERNGEVNLSVSNPRKRDMIEVTIP